MIKHIWNSLGYQSRIGIAIIVYLIALVIALAINTDIALMMLLLVIACMAISMFVIIATMLIGPIVREVSEKYRNYKFKNLSDKCINKPDNTN